MRFFLMEPDRTSGHIPQLKNWYNEYEQQKESKMVILTMKDDKDLIVPEVIVKPTLLIEQGLKDILIKYEPNMKFQEVSLFDGISGEIYTFYQPGLLELDSIDEGKKLNKVIYCVKEVYESKIIVRLDYMESMLRRNATGFLIKEV